MRRAVSSRQQEVVEFDSVAGGRYRFRLRFDVSEGRRINIDEAEILLHDDQSSVVWLRALGGGQPLQDADTWLLLGSAYTSESEAVAAGVRWRGVLEQTFAVLSIAADFGDYAPKGGGFTQALLEEVRETTGHLVANEIHGLMVVPDDVDTLVFSASAKGRAGTPEETFLRAFSEATQCPDIDDRTRLAFDIYSAAGFVSESPAARMVMLMMALEAMIDVGERDGASRAHIDRLLEVTEKADLDAIDAGSITNALRGLKRESIRSAGGRLASTMNGRTYGGLTPTQFFARCYAIRSALVHGAATRPARDDVGRTAAQLEVFVGHLIAGRTLVDAVLPE